MTSASHPTSTPDRLVVLHGDGVQLIVDARRDHPVIVHWGASLGDVDEAAIDVLLDEAFPGADLDDPVNAGALRERARGFTGRPAVSVHRAGADWSPRFTLTALDHDSTRAQIKLADEEAGIAVDLSYRIEESGVLFVDVVLENTGADPLVVDEISTWLPVPDRVVDVVDFSGRWLRERQLARRAIGPGTLLREGRAGRSGHDYTIVQSVVTEGADTDRGEVWSLALLWSGNTRHLVERAPTGRTTIGAGELLEPGEVILAAQERYEAPTVAAIYSADGLDGMGARVHRWLRARPEHPTRVRPRPLTLNVWEAVYFDHDLERLTALADVAAEVGVERFVLDDGWFGSRRDDSSGLGDWSVSPDVWPDGLRPLADHVRSRGMEFGLWFEGEMVNLDSELYRAHPDWILQVGSRVPPAARHQLVLDLSNPDAYAHVLESVHAVIADAGVSYIKWDHNRALVDPGHHGHAAARRQTLAIYALFDELKRRTTGLEIESCASGGGRVDLGMALHADRFWTSDSNDALERQEIQRWTSLVIPPEMLGTHVGPTISHSSGRRASIQFRAVTALFGHAGIEWNLLEASSDELAALTAWAAFYRRERNFLHGGRVVRPRTGDPALQANGVVADDGSRAIIAVVQLRTSAGSRPATFPIPHLTAEARYRVTTVDFGGAGTIQHRAPQWPAREVVLTGAALMLVGLRPPILLPEEAILLVVERLGD